MTPNSSRSAPASSREPGNDAQKRPPVVRFAPSPTGFLHIGGARTALFNLLFARHTGGTYLLRVEDTDRARSTQEAVDAILDGLAWLDLMPDAPPVFQSTRAGRHLEVVHDLLEGDRAYRCWMTVEDIEAQRASQRAEGAPLRLRSPWRDRQDGPTGTPFVVRLKAPETGHTIVPDRVQGQIRFPNADLDDFVLLRSDGTPTYMLAVVVDDHDMGVSHVIRGDDHLSNTPRQLALIDALGWPAPDYAHVPMIHGADGAKLSKRHGALGVDAYRDMGFLPEALENYLLRLGWAHGDVELLTRKEAIPLFSLEGINRSPARFDMKKLEHVNRHHLQQAENARLVDLVAPRLESLSGTPLPVTAHDLLLRSMDDLKSRAKDINGLSESALYLVRRRPLPIDEPARKALDEGRPLLVAAAEALAGAGPWEREALEAAVKAVAEATGVGLGKVAAPLRAALTGSTVSPSVFGILEVLGRDESLGRIGDALGADWQKQERV
jgi:glutamyl-tRNA synthetase